MSPRGRIVSTDQKILARLAAADTRRTDDLMERLGRAANHGGIWLAVAAGLGMTRSKWARRAALRGVASLTIGSAAANVVTKQLVKRSRPEESSISLRWKSKPMRTTSFPSGHAASAAAFATGVALELPVLAVPVGGLAAAVGVSRVVTGKHYPSDVAAGFALGTAAGFLTLRWWPRRPAVPAAAARPRHDAPAAPTGQGLVLVVNCSAGTASEDLADSMGKSLPDAEIVVASADDDLTAVFEAAAGRARILGVAGGDGSVRVAAAIAADAGLPLLAVPAGTFNHFTADLGVHSAEDAIAALQAGDSVRVDVAAAGDEAFLNTASAGIYTDLVSAREQLEPALGKWPALLVALVRVLRTSKPLDLTIDGRRRLVWLIFAGNCRYEPAGAAPSYRPDLADGALDIRLVDGTQPLARVRLVAAVLLGTLGRSRVYREWSATSLQIASAEGDPVRISLDGEVTETEPGIRLFKAPKALLVYRPDTA